MVDFNKIVTLWIHSYILIINCCYLPPKPLLNKVGSY